MKNKLWRRLPSLLLAAALCAALAVPALAAEGEAEEPAYRLTVTLRTAEDVLALGRECSLDSWSRDVLVILADDISLAGIDFTPIPSFGGTLEGRGHTISGLELTGGHAPAGLFARVQSTGVLRDLRVEGSVLPAGDGSTAGGIAGINSGRVENCSFTGSVSAGDRVGGIAGRNTLGGVITGCRASGGVFGRSMTGGIVGENLGTVSGCENTSYVNIQSVDPTLRPEALEINDLRDLLALASADTLNLTSDTGGIAGYSSGTISDCRNEGTVGYQHVGYNVGGIAGRSCGFVEGCANAGEIYGRKEIGGIVGQAEPYVVIRVAEDMLETLSGEMGGLNALINNAIRNTDDSMDDLASAFVSMAGLLKPVRDAIENISDYTDPSALEDLMRQISAAMSGVQSQINAISGQMRQVSGTLSDDFRRINNQISAISGTTIDAMSAISGGSLTDVVTDSSQVDIDAVTEGKILACANSGRIYGDINVGGIAGAMAIEQALDPEDDLHTGVSSTVRTEYQLKAILQQCVNTGEILSKKDGAGGICGRMDLGLIYRCEGGGSVESESGNYVGGIAGLAYSTVRSSWAKCTLRGGKYVGGIIGCGDTDALTGVSSEVVDCLSMVEIPRYDQYAGAIAGYETGSFAGNRFVSDTLSGINTLSYEGLAEPVSYAALRETEGLPDIFRTFSLTFVADGQTVKSLTFDYGSSFAASVFPRVPEKSGFYGLWDRTSLTQLHFDTVVQAEYYPRITALPSAELRGEGRPVLYVEGQFQDRDALTLSFPAAEAQSMEPFSQSWAEFIRAQLAAVLRGERPDSSIAREIVELWELEIPEDGLAVHTVRYRSPGGGTTNLRLYLDTGDGWELAPVRSVGSYLVFDVTGSHVRGAVISTIRTLWLALGAVLAVLLAVLLLFALTRLRRFLKRRRKRSAGRLSLLRPVSLPPAMRRKWRRIVLAALAAVLLGGGAAAAVLHATGLRSDWEVYSQLRELLSREELDMTAHVVVKTGASETETDLTLCRTRLDKQIVTRLEAEGIPFYCSHGVVYLENGKAFAMEDAAAAPENLPDAVLRAFRASEIRRAEDGDRTVYRISVPAEQAGELLSVLFPFRAAALREEDTVTVELVQEDGDLSSMRIAVEGADISARAELAIEPRTGGHSLPEAVTDAITAGADAPTRILTEDVVRLLAAWRRLEDQPSFTADLRLYADCGALLLDEELEYLRATVRGVDIRGLRRDAMAVYFTRDAVCGPDGRALSAGQEALLGTRSLWEVAGQLIQNGDFACRTGGERSVYTLTLDEAQMRAAAGAIAPRTAELGIRFTSGTLRAVVVNGALTEMEFLCSGSLRIVLADVNAVVGAQLYPRAGYYVYIPRAVRDALAPREGG